MCALIEKIVNLNKKKRLDQVGKPFSLRYSYIVTSKLLIDGWFFKHTRKTLHREGKLKTNHLCYYSGLNVLFTPNQSHFVNLSITSS